MKKFLYLFFCILIIVLLSACGDSEIEIDMDKHESLNYESYSKEEKVSKDGFLFDGKNLITPYYSIEITDYKVIQPGEDNNHGNDPVIVFSFDATVNEESTNQSITTSTAWISSFEVIQDNDPNLINTLDLGTYYDEGGLEDKKIKPGGTASGYMSYNLTDNDTPVTLIALEDMVQRNVIAEHDYEIK